MMVRIDMYAVYGETLRVSFGRERLRDMSAMKKAVIYLTEAVRRRRLFRHLVG